jgi:shikimate dehydrogenase
MMNQLGLIGYPLGHSFSKKYFTQKFDNEGISNSWHYELYAIDNIEKLYDVLNPEARYKLVGLNVTIPYKTAILPFLDAIDPDAAAIGAVNCIKISWGEHSGIPHLTGYNTDVFGVEKSLLKLLGGNVPKGLQGLILGTGGAAKAVAYVLAKHKIAFKYVSRTGSGDVLGYENVDKNVMNTHRLIINSTPLGTMPNVEGVAPLPFEFIDNQHFIFDLIYNPEQTRLMKIGLERGARVANGAEMLIEQAEQGWRIWSE